MLSRLFNNHPVFASVVSILVLLLALTAYFYSPGKQHMELTPPRVSVEIAYPAVKAQSIGDTTEPVKASASSEAESAALERGTNAYESRRFDEALIAFQEAVRLAPNNPDPTFRLSLTLVALGKIDEADTVLKTLVEKFPETKDTLGVADLSKKIEELKRQSPLPKSPTVDPLAPTKEQVIAIATLRATLADASKSAKINDREAYTKHLMDARRQLDPLLNDLLLSDVAVAVAAANVATELNDLPLAITAYTWLLSLNPEWHKDPAQLEAGVQLGRLLDASDKKVVAEADALTLTKMRESARINVQRLHALPGNPALRNKYEIPFFRGYNAPRTVSRQIRRQMVTNALATSATLEEMDERLDKLFTHDNYRNVVSVRVLADYLLNDKTTKSVIYYGGDQTREVLGIPEDTIDFLDKVTVVLSQSDAGDYEGASQSLASIESDQARKKLQKQLTTMVSRGRQKLLETARDISQTDAQENKNASLLDVIRSLLVLGAVQEAEQSALLLSPRSDEAAVAYRWFGEYKSKTNDPVGSKQAFAKAIEVANSIASVSSYTLRLEVLASMIEAGFLPESQDLAATFSAFNSDGHVDAFGLQATISAERLVAKAQIARGDTIVGRQALSRLTSLRSQLLAAKPEISEVNKSLRLMRVDQTIARIQSLLKDSAALAESVSRLKKLAASMPADRRDTGYENLAKTLLDIGDVAGAQEVLQSIKSSSRKGDVAFAIAEKKAASGDVSGFKSGLLEFGREFASVGRQEVIVSSFLRRNDPEGAKSIAELVREEGQFSYADSLIAEYIARTNFQVGLDWAESTDDQKRHLSRVYGVLRSLIPEPAVGHSFERYVKLND